MYCFPTETELVHCSGVEVLDENIGFLDKFGKDVLSVGSLCVECERLLVGVELEEIITWKIGVELKFFTCCIANAGTFDFDDIGAKPCKHLGT